MKKTYIAADVRFFDEAAAQLLNMNVDQYNQMIIEKINNSVDKDDFLIFLGIISKGDIVQTSLVFNLINCKKIIIDYRNQKQFSIAQWRAIGIDYIWDTPGAQKSKIKDKVEFIVIGIDKEEILKDVNKYYVATAQSILDTEEIYKNKILNISMEQWNFEPIEIENRLPQIFDDQELFLRMEDIK